MNKGVFSILAFVLLSVGIYAQSLNEGPWSNHYVNGIGRLPAHATSYSYLTEEDALSCDRTSARIHSLNGTWKFRFAEDVSSASLDFWKDGFDVSSWDDITVPSCWEILMLHRAARYALKDRRKERCFM